MAASCTAPTEDWASSPGICPDQESNGWPLGSWADAPPLNHPGRVVAIILNSVNMNIQIYILPIHFFYYRNPRLQVKEMVNRECERHAYSISHNPRYWMKSSGHGSMFITCMNHKLIPSTSVTLQVLFLSPPSYRWGAWSWDKLKVPVVTCK